MGKGRNPCCKYCKKEVTDKTQAIKKSNGYYHLDCWEKFELEKEAKKTDYEKLVSYIYKLYNENIPPFVFKQIKDYKTEYGMKDKGILLTLKYLYEDLQMKFDESNGIGLVLYKYSDAERNWKKEQEVKKAVENFEFDDKEVIVNKKFDDNKLRYKPIDMEDL